MSIEMINFNANNYQEAVQGIKKIKTSNQKIQKQKNLTNIQAQKIIVRQIETKISGWLQKTEQGYLDPQTVRKIKMIKQQLQKQYQQHLNLIKQKQQSSNNQIRGVKNINQKQTEMNQGSQSEGYLDMDFQMQRKLQQKRKNELNQIHHNIIKVNSIIQQASELINDHGQKLDIIQNNFNNTKQNVQQSNKHLDQANEQQKKGNKKTFIFVIIAIVMSLCFIGYFLFF